jgi:hypothetical protein
MEGFFVVYNNASIILWLFFFSNTHGAYHYIKQKIIDTVFGYNPNETESRWTQTGKPSEHNLNKRSNMNYSHLTQSQPKRRAPNLALS